MVASSGVLFRSSQLDIPLSESLGSIRDSTTSYENNHIRRNIKETSVGSSTLGLIAEPVTQKLEGTDLLIMKPNMDTFCR